MKGVIGLLLMLVAIEIPSIAQDEPVKLPDKNVLKVNSLSMLVGTGSIFYERRINELSSAQFGFAYLNLNINDTKFKGLIITPEWRFYLRKDALGGFYVAPYFRYQQFSLEAKDNSKATFLSYGGGALLGRQWTFESHFDLDLFFGGTYNKGTIDITSGTDSFNTNTFEGFRPRIGLALGFSF